MSLVAAASMAGLATQQEDPDAGVDTGFLVSSVRGANENASATPDSLLPSPVTESADALDVQSEELTLLDRGAPAVAPSSTAPKPTPVAVDPDATPIPPPTTALGQAGGQGTTAAPAAPSAPSTRAAAPVAPAGLVWPVPGGSVSQYFHAGHLAVDIAAPYGNQVVAAQAGVVTWSGWRNNGGGYVVSIDHGNGMRTTYNHLGNVWVSAGQWVAAGQLIAPVGCTGICTGPHVHFEVVVNGMIDNPMRWY
ncbi:MAG: peptidoglycan DD-metalloendopeptidase family protein [Chloroflexi bacterium]|nr:peptidoglycan DD-metalloendopeptidase family protein [Chloroflexota bacterium]